ncbi:MAG: ElyC/SanA/YdcF family protein [Sulfurimonas sp.]
MEFGTAFLLKKAIGWLLMPMPIAAAIFLSALWALWRKRHKRAKYFLSAGILWLGLVSHAYFSSLLLGPLESRYSRLEEVPPDTKYILLLGGDKERRAWEAIRLYQKLENARIITSGYSMHDEISDAYKTMRLLKEAGVKGEDIIMQEEVKDTKEEAIRMKQRVGADPFLLVTSAYHMPRSMLLFQKEGLHPVAAPGDFNDRGDDSIWSLFQAKHLQKTERALHEYIGLLWTFLNGAV